MDCDDRYEAPEGDDRRPLVVTRPTTTWSSTRSWMIAAAAWCPFGIKQSDRLLHFYAISKTGAGKSPLIETLIRQDIDAGRGVALIDPHGDLVVNDESEPDDEPSTRRTSHRSGPSLIGHRRRAQGRAPDDGLALEAQDFYGLLPAPA